MRKHRLLASLLILITCLTLLSSCERTDYTMTIAPLDTDSTTTSLTHILHPDAEVRGVWIASVYNIDYPSRTDLDADALRAEIDAILDTCEKNKLNTIFFQVRPACDALYKSDLFPVSPYMSSAGTLVFDPLEYIVTEGHKRNIRIHAWVNPLRVTMNSHDIDALPEMSPARQHPEWVVPYADGKLYLNAGLPEVHQLIADGVAEIVRNYDVDGVVFDDYFYPYPVNGEDGKQVAFADDDAFAQYGTGYEDRAAWRRDNINKMVKLVYDTVHAIDDDCDFGISPFAIWQNNNGKNGGSDTNGFEGYHSLHCDALAWVEGGYVDYLSPQIYWTFDNKSAPFDVLTRWWNAALDGTDVKLYISHASYRYEDGNWENPEGQLTEQITYARAEKQYYGSVCYGYDEINRNIHGASDDLLAAYQNDIIYTNIASNGRGIEITSPAYGFETAEEHSYLLGLCDPAYPLTVSGPNLVDNTPVSMTKSGYFNLYLALDMGQNTFTFRQNGQETSFTIIRVASFASAPEPEKEIAVLDSFRVEVTYPTSEIITGEDILWVSCNAPYGSRVTATVGGITTELAAMEKPAQTWAWGGYVSVPYGANIALPAASDGDILDCGAIRYTITHNDGTTYADGTTVRALGKDAFVCVRAKENYTHLKITESSSYYNDYTVQSAGMTDYAVALREGFYRLRMGGFVSADDVEEVTDPTSFPSADGAIAAASVYNAGDATEFRLTCADRPPYNGAIEDDRFVLTFYNMDAAQAPMPSMGDNPLLSSCEIVRLDDRVRYAFTLCDVENFYGFDLRYTDDGVIVSLKNPIAVDLTAEQPLTGIRIVLDAGHGGDDRGAVGILKTDTDALHEKHLNRAITDLAAEQLTALGADVALTRVGDETLDLYARMAYLEDVEPDLCVSIHQNSMGYAADITRIRGTLSLWCMDSGRLLADCVGNAVASSLGRNYRGAQYQMLAMCRNPKFPQALVEVGFITSAEEYEVIASDDGIARAAEGITRGILAYFARQTEYASA